MPGGGSRQYFCRFYKAESRVGLGLQLKLPCLALCCELGQGLSQQKWTKGFL